MKKRLLALLIVCTLLPLASTAYATEPVDVEGYLDYWLTSAPVFRQAGPNVFMEATEHEIYAGTWTGEGDSVFTVGMFKDFWTVYLRCEFTGTVGGREGTMSLQLVGKKPLVGEWSGTWAILSGTGELATAHGEGIWGGPGTGAEGPDCWYSGQMHFDP